MDLHIVQLEQLQVYRLPVASIIGNAINMGRHKAFQQELDF